jgi:hypothetical protein
MFISTLAAHIVMPEKSVGNAILTTLEVCIFPDMNDCVIMSKTKHLNFSDIQFIHHKNSCHVATK